MSQKLSSQRTFMEVADLGTPSEWIRVGGLSNVRDMFSGTAAEIDVTDLDSTGKEYILGLADFGTMGADFFFDPADPGQIILRNLQRSSAVNSFRVGVPNPLQGGSPTGFTIFTYQGSVRTMPFTAAVDAALVGSVEIRVTGDIDEA